jgi:hypothetical protein
MARVSVSKLITSAVVGGVDLMLENMGKKDIRDIYRLAVVAGSGLINYIGIEREYTEAAMYSAIPLLERTAYEFVKARMGYPVPASSAGFRMVTPPQQESKPITPVVVTPPQPSVQQVARITSF